MKQLKTFVNMYFIRFCVLLILLSSQCFYGQETFEIRGWDIENYQPDYIYEMIDKAASMNANVIGFSHEICMNVEEIIYDWHRYQHLVKFIDYAHSKGMKVYLWTHEVNGDIEQWLEPLRPGDKKRRLRVDEPELYDYITEKYRLALERVPNCDGFVLSLTESRWQVQRDNEIVSKLSQAERMAKVINAVYKGLAEKGKTLLVRDFLRSPKEMDSFLEALKQVPDEVWVYTKCVPNDWQFSFPPHPLLGKVAPHKQIMELDLATEAGGITEMSMCIVDYIQFYLQMAAEKGLAGAIARCDDGLKINKGTANEINIWAYGNLLNNPYMDKNKIWSEWCNKRYGEKGGPVAEHVLRRTFEIVNKLIYTLGFKGAAAAESRLLSWSNAQWDPSPQIKRIENGLLHPDKFWIDTVVTEKREAEKISQYCIDYLDRYGNQLNGEDYQTLRENFERCVEHAKTAQHSVKTFFTLRQFRENRDIKVLQNLEQALIECDNFIADAPNRKWPRVNGLIDLTKEVRKEIAAAKTIKK